MSGGTSKPAFKGIVRSDKLLRVQMTCFTVVKDNIYPSVLHRPYALPYDILIILQNEFTTLAFGEFFEYMGIRRQEVDEA